MAEPEERIDPIPAPARRDSLIVLVLLGVTAFLYLLQVPWAFAMIVTGPAAAAIAVRALVRSWNAPGVTMFRVWLGIGIMLGLMSAFMGLTFMLFADVITQLSDCNNRAVTQQARAQCEAEYDEGVRTTIENVLERAGLTVPE